jgi:hypothetical protein
VRDHYQILSAAFTVRSVDEDFASALGWHLSSFSRAAPSRRVPTIDFYVDEADAESDPIKYTLADSGNVLARYPHPADLLNLALWSIFAAVPQEVQDFLLLHSGAVARDGQAILLPAWMDSGKSTTVLALLHAGFEYLSDEYGALDPVTEHAYPVPKNIGVDARALERFEGLAEKLDDRRTPPVKLTQRYVRPQDIGARVAAPSEVRWIVFTAPVWEGPPRLIPLSRAQAVQEMAENCFNLHRYGERAVVLLSHIADQAKPFRLEGGTPLERAELIDQTVT